MAQLNSASDFGSEGYRFESCRGHADKGIYREVDAFFLHINQVFFRQWVEKPLVRPNQINLSKRFNWHWSADVSFNEMAPMKMELRTKRQDIKCKIFLKVILYLLLRTNIILSS